MLNYGELWGIPLTCGGWRVIVRSGWAKNRIVLVGVLGCRPGFWGLLVWGLHLQEVVMSFRSGFLAFSAFSAVSASLAFGALLRKLVPLRLPTPFAAILPPPPPASQFA